MNAKRTQDADTKTMGDKTQRSVLDGDVVATGQSNSGSRASNGRAKKLLADTDKSKTTQTKTRRTKKKKRMTALQGLRDKSPFKAIKPKRKGTGRPQGAGTGFVFNTPINRKLNTDRTESRAVEFSIKRAFGT